MHLLAYAVPQCGMSDIDATCHVLAVAQHSTQCEGAPQQQQRQHSSNTLVCRSPGYIVTKDLQRNKLLMWLAINCCGDSCRESRAAACGMPVRFKTLESQLLVTAKHQVQNMLI
jgi:hypothetical protein